MDGARIAPLGLAFVERKVMSKRETYASMTPWPTLLHQTLFTRLLRIQREPRWPTLIGN